jgi:hypothetical protein
MTSINKLTKPVINQMFIPNDRIERGSAINDFKTHYLVQMVSF